MAAATGQRILLHFEGGGRPPAELVPSTGRGLWCIGRDPASDIVLEDRSVSRRHAEIECVSGIWRLRSLGQGGTWIGAKVAPAGEWIDLDHGMILGIGPYALRTDLRTSLAGSQAPGERAIAGAMTLAESGANARIAAVPAAQLESLAELRLSGLLAAAGRILGADDENGVAQAAVETLVAARDFGRAMVAEQRQVDGAKVWRELAVAPDMLHARERPFSRTLMEAAVQARGMVRLSDEARFQAAHSVMAAGTTDALCLPIGSTGPVRVLYVDTGAAGQLRASAVPFANLVGQLAGLAIDALERRRMASELAEARRMQGRLLPPEQGARGCGRWTLVSRPGRQVSGDLFTIIDRPEGGVLAILGDVAGKGAPAGLVMASMLAHLDSALGAGLPIEGALAGASSYLAQRASFDSSIGSFVTLFAVELTPAGECRAVDAGHAYAIVVRADGTAEQLVANAGGPPVGVLADAIYASDAFRLGTGDRVVLFSDGLAEQPDATGAMLGMDGVVAALQGSRSGEEDVARLIARLESHARGEPWADDVTIASIVFAPADPTAV